MTAARGTQILTAALLAAAPAAHGAALDAPTFYGDVLAILQHKCQDCHRPVGSNFGGMVAPMSLMTYDETRPWAKAISREVSRGEMPPWDADRKFNGVFANERTLSEEQTATLVRWVETGAPAGDPASAPPARVFESTDGWIQGEPDLVLTIPVAYEVGDDVSDVYTAFPVDLTPEMLPDDVYIRGFQCKPGTPIIHHFNANLLPPDENGELAPPPTRIESDAIAPEDSGRYLGGVASGAGANWYPEGYAVKIPKGSRITFDIHYTKDKGPGTRVVDSTSQVGFYFSKEPPKHVVSILNAALFNIDLPPGRAEYRLGPASIEVPQDSEILALTPHMHTRGKGAKFVAFYPDGTTEVLLEVPTYDFAWQTAYYYDQLKQIPAGTRLEFTAWYDNSPDYAAARGFDPAEHVRFGRWSSDEMMMGFVLLAPTGD